jgi:lipopolysaccharide transport system ATP-binding protein
MISAHAGAMNKPRPRRVAIFGTFDVQNYGDLLFPIIAEMELSQRLGAVEIIPFSYDEKSQPEWPYDVVSITEFPRLACDLDAILIGGGFIVRFDKVIAPGYGPPESWIHHPTGYWLTPALIGVQHGIPVVWNAPGMHCNDIPDWSHPFLSLALENSPYIAVRDEPTKAALAEFVDPQRVNVIPDTAFSMGKLLGRSSAVEEATSLLKELSLTTPYVVVQATQNLERFTDHVKRFHAELEHLSFLVVRIGPVLCDHESFIDPGLPATYHLADWPSPLVLAALISGSEAVVGHSYHLAITALSSGVPVFSSSDLSVGKFTALARYQTVYPLPPVGSDDPRWLVDRIGRRSPVALAIDASTSLEVHWDHVAGLIQNGKTATAAAANAFWMHLPSLLEGEIGCGGVASPEDSSAAYKMQSREEEELHQKLLARMGILEEEHFRLAAALDDMQKSISWRMTSPFRRAISWLRG